MSFGSQAVFIWFIYLRGASSILGLSHSEKAWAVILARGGVRVPELKLRNVSVPTHGACGLPSIGRAQQLHLAACPVIDADHQGQALPTPVSVVPKKERERCPFL